MLKKNDQITVRLFPGDRQAIEVAAMEYGLSMSEFCRIMSAGAAQKIIEYERAKLQGQTIEAEWVRECEVSLPKVPQPDPFGNAEKVLHNTFARRQRRG